MASDGDGFVWVFVIGLAILAWNADGKLKSEKTDRIDAVYKVDRRVSDLESRIAELETKLKVTEYEVEGVASAHESLRKTFNSNVDIANKAKVARMTADGACGTETVRYPDGGWAVRNKECTLKDLK